MTIESENNLGVIERVEQASPLNIERKEVVTPVATQFTAQVSDNSGQPVITAVPSAVSVTVPAVDETLTLWKKGKVTDSLTWLGYFGMRMVKKALHFGWNVVVGGRQTVKEA